MMHLSIIKGQVEDYWKEQSIVLKEKILTSFRFLNKILDEHKNDDKFSRDFGDFADSVIDTNFLLNTLSKAHSKDRLSIERREGIEKAIKILENIVTQQFQNIPQPEIYQSPWEKEIDSLFPMLEKHYKLFTEIFFALRIAEIEHNASFVRFSSLYRRGKLFPHQVTREEWKLASTFIVYDKCRIDNHLAYSQSFSKIAMNSFPVKLVLFEDQIYLPEKEMDEEEFASTQVPTDMVLFVPGLQKIHYFQAPYDPKDNTISEKLIHIWKEAGTAVLRLYLGSDLENPSSNLIRAALGRYIPFFEYNPHLDFNFVKCILMDGNSKPKEAWGFEKSKEGEKQITFADFVYLEKLSPDHFRDPSPNEKKRPMPLSDYLELDKFTRIHYYPTIKDENGRTKIPSIFLVTLSAEKAKIWRTLQNWSCINNPVFDEAEKDLEQKHQKEMNQELKKQKDIFIEEKKVSIQEAFKSLAKNIMENKTGKSWEEILNIPLPKFDSLSTSIKSFEVNPSQVIEKPAISVASAPSMKEKPYIETHLCTACDECVSINRNIFAYDSNRQAYVKNPTGGPYRDIVKAAEKCSVGIIHPGLPHDKSEKDLEKLLKRAEKYRAGVKN